MKKPLLRLIFILITHSLSLIAHCSAQTGWAWMKGFNGANSNGNFGTQGIPDPANNPPALYEPAEWTDLQGNFWLFGGMPQTISPVDGLWKFDPALNEWTWVSGSAFCCEFGVYGVQGVADPANHPGARKWAAATWVDLDGNLWLFGGVGYDGGGVYSNLNDLWKYDITTHEWAWMKGSPIGNSTGSYGTKGVSSPSNEPISRHECGARWTDNNGNLWLFGGYTTTSQLMNDLWEFNVTTGEWTWMNGDSAFGQPGVYGVKGIPDSANSPGARGGYTKLKDSQGNFWLFGGANGLVRYNDLWRFDPVNNEWTWMSGPNNNADSAGIYTSYCDPDTGNLPRARYENRACWIDGQDRLWFFGGWAYSVVMNDLWYYDIASGEWNWVSGSSAGNQSGVWGAQGIADPANHPSGRVGSVSWMDSACHQWLFGGIDFNTLDFYNDLWKFTADSACGGNCTPVIPSPLFGASSTSLCEKFCLDFFDQSTNNPLSWQWIFPGGDPAFSSDQNPTNICYDLPGVYDVTLITTNANGNDTLTLTNYITVYPTPPFPTITQVGYTLTSSPATSYQWQFNSADIPGATNQSYTILQTGYYTVIVSDTNGCINSITVYIVISGISDLMSDGNILVYPNPSSGNFIVEWINPERIGTGGLIAGEVMIDVVNTLGQKVFSSEEPRSIGTAADFLQGAHSDKEEIDLSDVARGVYFIEIKTEREFVRKKILIAD
ncbi:MAG TPA: kelch repeat-containing protein [Chitinophagales bacterium]|nr:kelch repeat-containing protein [Chitinophagales bacterium]